MLVHSLLLLGTFASSVSTSCYLALLLLMFVLAVTWHFSYFPTGVAVEIRYQRTSPDSAKVHWARQELGAEEKKPMRVFSGSRQFITWGNFDHRCKDSTNFTCLRKINACREKKPRSPIDKTKSTKKIKMNTSDL